MLVLSSHIDGGYWVGGVHELSLKSVALSAGCLRHQNQSVLCSRYAMYRVQLY